MKMNLSMPSAPSCARFLLAASLCAALLGCGRKEAETTTPPPSPAAEAPKGPPAEVAEAGGGQTAGPKLQGYIECYNQVDENAHRSIARYASWVKDMKSGPTGREKVVYGLYQTRSDQIAQCQQTFAQVAAMKPALPKLDAAGASYIAALVALDKVVAEAHTYYDRENYKDDQFAKGRELHAPLAASFEAFKAASSVFSDALEAENDVLLDARLAEVEKAQGRKLAYFQMALMSHAKHLSRTVGEEAFDVPKAVAQLAVFEKTADEAQAYAKAHTGEAPPTWSMLESAGEDFRKAAKERVRRLRDNVPYSQGEQMMLKPGSAWMVEGSSEKLVRAYNALVTASNNL